MIPILSLQNLTCSAGRALVKIFYFLFLFLFFIFYYQSPEGPIYIPVRDSSPVTIYKDEQCKSSCTLRLTKSLRPLIYQNPTVAKLEKYVTKSSDGDSHRDLNEGMTKALVFGLRSNRAPEH